MSSISFSKLFTLLFRAIVIPYFKTNSENKIKEYFNKIMMTSLDRVANTKVQTDAVKLGENEVTIKTSGKVRKIWKKFCIPIFHRCYGFCRNDYRSI